MVRKKSCVVVRKIAPERFLVYMCCQSFLVGAICCKRARIGMAVPICILRVGVFDDCSASDLSIAPPGRQS